MTGEDVLTAAIELVKAGRKAEANQLLEPYVLANPQNVAAWLWIARTRLTTESRIVVLENCLIQNPDDRQARQALDALYTQAKRNPPKRR